jgi:hypothetical protein
MNKSYAILITLFLLTSWCSILFSQSSIPISTTEIDKQEKVWEINASKRLRSITTYEHLKMGGNILPKKYKIKTEFYGEYGQSLEIQFFNIKGGTDSIYIFTYKGSYLYSKEVFLTSGELLSKTMFTYNDAKKPISSFFYRNKIMVQKTYFFYSENNQKITEVIKTF